MNVKNDLPQAQQLCFDILHQVYSEPHPLTAIEISQAIDRPLRSISLLIDQLVQSGYLQTQLGDGLIYYHRPNQELLRQPHLPLPYHVLNWDRL